MKIVNKYQIMEVCLSNDNIGATYKAVDDASKIAYRAGYKKVYIKNRTWKVLQCVVKAVNRVGFIINWIQIYFVMEKNSILFWQGPNNYSRMMGRCILQKLKVKKNITLVSLFHDIDELRYEKGVNSKYTQKSKKQTDFMIINADYIVVHNDRMLEYLASCGVGRNRLISLEIFDYLIEKKEKEVKFNNKLIIIAGNLDISKSGYVYQLGRIKNINWKLYGTNFGDKGKSLTNVRYYGSIEADKLPDELTEGFGLVWDGDSIEECTGGTGNYLRYNNPHKLSLYLAAGIPVIIWSGAAEASFVKKHSIGICVESLLNIEEELDKVSPDLYENLLKNVKLIAGHLQQGYYLTKALEKIENSCNVAISTEE